MFCDSWCLLVFTGGKHTAVDPVWLQVQVPLILSGGSFLGLGSFVRACLRAAYCTSPEFSLDTCPANSWSLSPISLNQWVYWKLCYCLEILSKHYAIANEAHLISCLLGITVIYCGYPVFEKLLIHTFCPFFDCFKQENKSSLCYSILARSAIPLSLTFIYSRNIYWVAIICHVPLG